VISCNINDSHDCMDIDDNHDCMGVSGPNILGYNCLFFPLGPWHRKSI